MYRTYVSHTTLRVICYSGNPFDTSLTHGWQLFIVPEHLMYSFHAVTHTIRAHSKEDMYVWMCGFLGTNVFVQVPFVLNSLKYNLENNVLV